MMIKFKQNTGIKPYLTKIPRGGGGGGGAGRGYLNATLRGSVFSYAAV